MISADLRPISADLRVISAVSQLTSARSQVTSWPSAIAVAASWDVTIAYSYAAAIGREFRAKGANVILGPSVNVHRTPFNGRNAEYLSGVTAVCE